MDEAAVECNTDILVCGESMDGEARFVRMIWRQNDEEKRGDHGRVRRSRRRRSMGNADENDRGNESPSELAKKGFLDKRSPDAIIHLDDIRYGMPCFSPIFWILFSDTC
jgi:hypothetical protein